MPRVWLDVAAAIGCDSFLTMWMILDRAGSFQEAAAGEPLRIRLRRFRSYLRFQRNRFIESLVAAGKTPDQIRATVQERLCEVISTRHILRIGGKR